MSDAVDKMTDEEQKKNYLIFQLQDRLQSAIRTLEGVKGAIVTISIPQQDSFVLEEDKVSPSASVVIDLKAGASLTDKQIKGIEQLVAKSVPGLKGENVSRKVFHNLFQ